MAAALTAYRNAVQERLRQAELGRERAQVQAAEERKRRRLTVALGAAGLLVLLLAAGFGLWVQRQRAALREEVTALLGQAARLRRGDQFEEARRLLDQAGRRLDRGGPADLRAQVDQALADTALAERLDQTRQRASTVVEGKLDFAGAEQGYAEVLAGLGGEGEEAEAVGARVRASAVRAEVVAALDEWAGITKDEARRGWLLDVARAADPDPERDRLRQPALWRDREALARLAGEARVTELSPQLACVLGRTLFMVGGDPAPLLRAAQAHHPQDFWLNFDLGGALKRAKRLDEAIGFFRAALALRPRASAAHSNLGVALAERGRLGEAVEHYEQALRLDPECAPAHINLGNALHARGKRDEAIAHFREAIRLAPGDALGHYNLGNALSKAGRSDEAAGHYEQALRLDPGLAAAHNQLGNLLYDRGKLDEAAGHHEQALRIDPRNARAHSNLGRCLADKGKPDEAIRHYEQALRLDPKLTEAHLGLGVTLFVKGKAEEAAGHFEEALRIDPKDLQARYKLAYVLQARGRLEEAVGQWEEVLRGDPKNARALAYLGQAFLGLGRWGEARKATRRCLDLLPPTDPLRGGVNQQLQVCERMLALAPRLPAVLRGEDRPAGANEAIEFAKLCQATKRPAAAARFYAEAFAADPKLAADLLRGDRYNAACCAALAAARRGIDAEKLDGKERARLRRQALGWLRAEVAARAKQLKGWWPGEAGQARSVLAHGQESPDFACVRGKAALATLPAEERAEWEKLWAEVDDLLSKTDAAKAGR